MLVSFSISNFRSFSHEQTLSLVASNRHAGDHEDHALPIPDAKDKVLRTAVLYGANGAGKSNLFKALGYVESVALDPRKRNTGTNREPFKFADLVNEPSCFELQIIAVGKLYQFGFKVDDERIREEWLLQIDGGRQRVIYERLTDGDGQVTIDAPGIESGNAKLRALATVGGPQNQSFLATVNATLEVVDFGPDLAAVIGWFKNSLHLIGPDETYSPLAIELNTDPDFLAFASEFLKGSSTGVDHLEVSQKELSADEIKKIIPGAVLSKALKNAEKDAGMVVAFGEGNQVVLESGGGESGFHIRVQSAHEHKPGEVIRLELEEESDGTRRLLNLIPALHRLRGSGAVFFIDEIDRSLHPILVRRFLECFLGLCSSGQRQVIVTTHESSLLDQDLLRRDEIWFAEKDASAATHLYSLVDFKVRNDLEIRKHYLQGRFGAVPFIGGFEHLRTEPEHCK